MHDGGADRIGVRPESVRRVRTLSLAASAASRKRHPDPMRIATDRPSNRTGSRFKGDVVAVMWMRRSVRMCCPTDPRIEPLDHHDRNSNLWDLCVAGGYRLCDWRLRIP